MFLVMDKMNPGIVATEMVEGSTHPVTKAPEGEANVRFIPPPTPTTNPPMSRQEEINIAYRRLVSSISQSLALPFVHCVWLWMRARFFWLRGVQGKKRGEGESLRRSY